MEHTLNAVASPTTLQVVNNLNESVKLFWFENQSSEKPPSITQPIAILSHGETKSLPLQTTGKVGGGFYLQPNIAEYVYMYVCLLSVALQPNFNLKVEEVEVIMSRPATDNKLVKTPWESSI